MKNNNIITLPLGAIILLSVFGGCYSCNRELNYQTISHNELCGKTDYIYFTSPDTGYIITHIGDLYDTVHCTYVYQTVNGGECWVKVDSVPNFSFNKYSYTTYKDIVYGYMDDGTLTDKHWNSYICLIDLRRHQHRVRNEAIYGAGNVYVLNDSIHFPVYKEDVRCICCLDEELNDLFCKKDILPQHIKNISYNDSSLALITYDNKMYYFQSGQMSEYQINMSCDGILLSGDDCYVSFGGNEKRYGGVIRHDYLSGRSQMLDFPLDYNVIKILKSSNDSVIISCAQKDICGFCDDIVYSTDRGCTWKKYHLVDPVVFPEYSSYDAPYLYIKSTFLNEIYKLRIE